MRKKVNISQTKPRTKPSSKIILPDLKSVEKKVETLKSNVPILVRDPEDLKNVRS